MAEFLTTRGVSSEIEKIIIEARSNLFLVSPYLQFSKTLLERLKDTSNRGVKIYIIYGKDELKQSEKNALTELKTLELYFHENLHAKCYFNEVKLIITSMNMYQYSEANNREMGILLEANKETELFQKAVNEVSSIMKHSKIITIGVKEKEFVSQNSTKANYNTHQNGNNAWKSYSSKKTQQNGHCLRCKTNISFDPTSPYCYECYSVWANFKNPLYQEKGCHKCGNDFPSSMSYPLCFKCGHPSRN